MRDKLEDCVVGQEIEIVCKTSFQLIENLKKKKKQGEIMRFHVIFQCNILIYYSHSCQSGSLKKH